MAESVPTFRTRDSRRSLIRASALAAIAAAGVMPMGCFQSASQEDPYTVFMGESINSFDMALEPDGAILLLAKVGMHYTREDGGNDFGYGYAQKNIQSILFRRSNGGWNATPFRNLQNWEMAFPCFIRDREGRDRALIWDGGTVKSYSLQGDRWRPHFTIPGAERFNNGFLSGGRNWNHHGFIGFKDDSTLYFLVQDGDYKTRIVESSGRWSLPLSRGFNPITFHSGPGFDAVIGLQSVLDPSDETMTLGYRTVYYVWQQGQAEALRMDLGVRGMPIETFFAPYRNGTALFFEHEDSVHLFPLDAQGRPQAGNSAGKPGSSRVPGFAKTAADPEGCFQTVRRYDASIKSRPVEYKRSADSAAQEIFFAWNSCSDAQDTLIYRRPAGDVPYTLYDLQFRIRPDGTRILAMLESEQPQPGNSGPWDRRLLRTRLVVAQEKSGTWTTEVVDSR